jgi:hypothetical protein
MKALHKNCAEGDVLGVRGILSGSLELLESIGELRSGSFVRFPCSIL